jgi:hypothetical protein
MNEEQRNGILRDINGMKNTTEVFAQERMLHAQSRAVALAPLTSRPTPVTITAVCSDRGNSGFPV